MPRIASEHGAARFGIGNAARDPSPNAKEIGVVLRAAATYATTLSFGRDARAGLQNTLWRVAMSAITSALASE